MTETPVENTAAVTPRKRKSPATAADNVDVRGQLDSIEMRLAGLEKLAAEHAGRQVHHDVVLHAVEQGVAVITDMLAKHAPLLDRASVLMDPGSKLRAFRGKR